MSEPEAVEPKLSPRFDDAVAFARQCHQWQLRKGKDVPYLAHLLDVAALVLSDGGDEDQAIAGLLHDAVEEPGGVAALNEIRRRFGPHVAEIVERCADHDPAKDRPAWETRKRLYIEKLPHQPDEVLRVALADKLSNARELLADYRLVGEQVWNRFSAGREMLRYLRALADTFAQASKSPMADELNLVVTQLEELASQAVQPA